MKKRLSTLAALAVGATCVFAPAAAQAAPANQCWTNVETGESRCFTTFAAVVKDLSGGQVEISGGAASFGQSSADAIAVAAAVVTIGIVYENWSYTGASNTYVGEGGCDTNVDVDFAANLVGTVWDDRISSFKSFNDCETKLWSGVYTGSAIGFSGNVTPINAPMNDAGSSLQWR